MIRPFALATFLALTGCTTIVNLYADDADDPDVDAAVDAPASLDAEDPGDGCAVEVACPAPAAGHTSFCGRIWDTEAEQPIVALSSATASRCGAPTADGPCSLRIRYFDALDFASDPTSATALQIPDNYVDDCGRFRALDVPQTTFGFVAVVIDDAGGAPDQHVATEVILDEDTARPAIGLHGYATRRSTDTFWSTAATKSPSFSASGVLLSVFRYHGLPVSGVRVRRGGADVPAAETFAFSDPNPQRSTVVPAQEVTGANGSVLTIDAVTPVTHTGAGGEPAGCVWPQALGASTPGVVLVQHRDAQTPAGAPCP